MSDMEDVQETIERMRNRTCDDWDIAIVEGLVSEIEQLIKDRTKALLGQPAVEANRELIAKNTRLREALREIGKHKTYNEMDSQARQNTDSMTGHDYFIELARAASSDNKVEAND